MKKLISVVVGIVIGLTSIAQLPQRQLPNQFRDFLDHQQRLEMERPKIERKDGKVIITMSEERFRKVREMRRQNWIQPPCQICHRFHGKPHRRKI